MYVIPKDFISLAATGGGKYVLKYYKDGQRLVKRSYDFIRGVSYEADKPEEIDKDKLDDDLDKLDKLDDKDNS